VITTNSFINIKSKFKNSSTNFFLKMTCLEKV